MHRFYTPGLQLQDREYTLKDKEELHHLKQVLRLKAGASVTLLNGEGLIAQGRLQSVSATKATIVVSEIREEAPDSKSICLACAIPKKAKFETIIEKCTELGVAEITPLQTQRTEVLLRGAQALKKQTRYTTVAINAAKQCGRAFIPKIHPVTSFAEILKQTKNHLRFIPCLINDKNKQDLWANRKFIKKNKLITVFIGPEGDFTEEEVTQAIDQGAIPLTLGQNVLKVDTAAITTIGLIKFLTDNDK